MQADVVDAGLLEVESKLQEIVLSDITLLQDASSHIISSGGKRVRPQVVFLSYLAAGGTDITSVVPLASAVELVHTATLVHDDINDHSLTRRGKISVHARWGRTFALLTGDYLFTKVYELMAPYGAEFNIIMAKACVSLVEGETLQASTAKAGRVDKKTYKQIIELKTASLFQAAANMGARVAQADQSTLDSLIQYGYNLGLAFQIVDDVLDVAGDPDILGKPIGKDLSQGTGALMTQNGKKIRAKAISTAENDPIQKMMVELRSSGALELAMLQAKQYADRAKSAAEDLPPSTARDDLLSLIELVINRNR
ncbi:MAG: polyprenyl synthetase family protein [Anaerolineae bacterium]|nr:MAG: polyprenyl synthetase family protein [Anaerolineae bacterium]